MKTYIFLIALLFLSCSSTKKAKLYGRCGKHYFGCTQIEIKPDGTFEYFYFYDIGGSDIIKGTWEKVDGKILKLNSHKQPRIVKAFYTGKINPAFSDSLKIEFNDIEDNKLATISVNDGEQIKTTNFDGVCMFKPTFVKSIKYSFLGYDDARLEILNPNFNDFKIYARDQNFTYSDIYFTDELVKIKANKIIFLGHKYSLKRTSSNDKQWK